jgi:uncharacterized delta-60 repeat protein
MKELHAIALGAEDVVIRDSGKILIATVDYDDPILSGDFDMAVAQFNSDGSLDESFGDDGKRNVDFGSDEHATALTLDFSGSAQTNPFYGSIVAVGKGPQNVAGTSRSFAIARLTPNGDLDKRFDEDGKVSRGFSLLNSGAEDVLIQSNGKIVVCGAVSAVDAPEERNFALLRFRDTGKLDARFGEEGLVQIDFGGDDRAFSMIRSTETGTIIGGVSAKQFAIARVSNEGTPDSTFGNNGQVLTQFGNSSVASFGLFRGPGKRFTAAGGDFFASARYLEAGANAISMHSINLNGFEADKDIASFFVSRVERLPTPLRVYYTIGGTATHLDDYTGLTLNRGPIARSTARGLSGGLPSVDPKIGFVDIPANETFALVNITPVKDALIEGNETAVFSIMDTTGYDLARRSSVTLNIFDAQSTTLTPIADALVKQGTNADVNFGSTKTLQARNKTDANRRSYLKFDTSTVSPQIQSVKLRLFGNLETLTESNIVSSVHSVADTTWDEQAITFNNRPDNGSPALSQTTIIDNTFRWYEWDVTNYVKAEMAAGRNIISLVVRNATPSDALASFNSSEAILNKPQLFFIPLQLVSR